MHTSWKTALIAGAALVGSVSCATPEDLTPAALSAPVGTPPTSSSVDVIGLVDGTELVRFTTSDTNVGQPATISGLDGDTLLVGIDYRVQDDQLYGVGEAGGLYTLVDSGAATKVGQLSEALDGTAFGVDFNPAADALRIISDTGQNLRQPFSATPLPDTVVDTALTNPAQAPATGTVPATGVVAGAYTNNDTATTTATSLFVLDATASRISLQAPANAGTLSPTGSLGLDVEPASGFDIYTDPDGGNTAYATLKIGAVGYVLHTIDLLSGTPTRVGTVDANVSDIAVFAR